MVLLQAFEPPPLPVDIVYTGGGLLPLKIRAFLDFTAPRLKVRLAADLVNGRSEGIAAIKTRLDEPVGRRLSPLKPTCR